MSTLRQAAEEFLGQRRIAVAGVSRDAKQPANLIYRRLRDTGHEVFAVNPNAEEVEGDRAYRAVTAIPGGVDGVVIVTTPEVADGVVVDCVSAGVPRVWLHRGLGPGSISESAIAYCREHGVSVIPGGCPNMFGATADPGHRCLQVMLRLTGKIPASVSASGYPRLHPESAPIPGTSRQNAGPSSVEG
ncbi:MAG: CoA-binding protein [Solirubrobacterales bacterium]